MSRRIQRWTSVWKRHGRLADVREVAAAADLGSPRAKQAVANQYNLFFEGGLQASIGLAVAVGGVWGGLTTGPVLGMVFVVVVGVFYAYMSYGVLEVGWYARRGEVHLCEHGLVVARSRRARAFRWDDVEVDTYYDEGTKSRVWWVKRSDGKKFVLYASVDGVSPYTRWRLRRSSFGALHRHQMIDLAARIQEAVGEARARERTRAGPKQARASTTSRPGSRSRLDASQGMPRRPRSVRAALALLWTGAGLGLVRVAILLGQRGQLAKDQPTWTDEHVASVHATGVALAIVAVSIWVWLAVKNAQSRPWAIWVTGALALVNGVTAIIRFQAGWTFSQYDLAAVPVGEVGALLQLIDVVDVFVGLGVLGLLLERDVEAFYRLADHRRARRRMERAATGWLPPDLQRPRSVGVATALMHAAAAVGVLWIVVGTYPTATELVGMVSAGLWIWLAVKSAQGRGWARRLAAALVAVYLGVQVQSQVEDGEVIGPHLAEATGPAAVLSISYLGVVVGAAVLLYLPASSRHLRATTHALASSRVNRYEPDRQDVDSRHRPPPPSPVGAARRQLQRLDAALGTMSPRGVGLSVLGIAAALLLAAYAASFLLPLPGRLALVLAGLALGGMAALPFTNIPAKEWDAPVESSRGEGCRGLLLAVAYAAAAVGVFVGGINLALLADAPDDVLTLVGGAAFGGAAILVLAAFLALPPVDEPWFRWPDRGRTESPARRRRRLRIRRDRAGPPPPESRHQGADDVRPRKKTDPDVPPVAEPVLAVSPTSIELADVRASEVLPPERVAVVNRATAPELPELSAPATAVELELLSVEMPEPKVSVVVLRELLRERRGRRRLLPIYCGVPEAQAIALAVQRIETPMPMTHDLMRTMLDTIRVEVARVVVTELVEGSFRAEVLLRTAGEVHRLRCRPSDGIALAVRTGTPIFAEAKVLDEAGRSEEPGAGRAEGAAPPE